MRTTKAQLQAQLERTSKALGRPINHWHRTEDGRNVATIGALTLDKCYQGWQIQEIMNEGGGIRVLGGHYTLTAFETYVCLRAMEDAAEIIRDNQK